MLKRLLLAVALPVLAAAPVHAQTSFTTSGDVTFKVNVFSNTPFDFFLEAVNGQARRLLVSENGTQLFVDTKGQAANGDPSLQTPVDLGIFPSGTNLIFSLVAGGSTYSSTAFFLRLSSTSYNVDWTQGGGAPGNGIARLDIILTGTPQIQNAVCGYENPLNPCSDAPRGTVTSTPEPGTWALMATGLAGLIPVVRRRRSVSPS